MISLLLAPGRNPWTPRQRNYTVSARVLNQRKAEIISYRREAQPMLASVAMRSVRVWIVCCLAAVAGFAATPQTKKDLPPNVFLVTIDTLRADHVHCYGDDRIQTPALDGLARDGIRFTQAFTPSPITNTSHVTILTGLLPSAHGVTDFGIPLAEAHATWAELLHKRGYHTAAFIGAVILDSNTLAPGLNRGFDFYDNFPQHPQTTSRWGRLERRAMVVVRRAETWLDENSGSPVFVWVHLYDPHDPYEPPPPFSETYRDRLYDGEIAYADSALADFVSYLKRHNRYKDALIFVVGDHGEGLGEHHEDTHGIFLYDSTTHVPLIMKLPGDGDAGRVVDSQVRTTDILPTVLDLLHARALAGLDGESLQPYLRGTEASGRSAFGETDYPLHFGWAPLRSIRANGYKLIEAPRPEFYDLHRDSGEQQNLYQISNASTERSAAMLAELNEKIPLPAASTDTKLLPDPKDKIEQQNLLHTAMLAQEDGRPEQAQEALNRVLQLDPRSWMALQSLGELELAADDYAKAAAHLGTAREVRPGDANIAFEYGKALQKNGELAGARDSLDASLKLLPSQFPARLLLGEVYLDLRDGDAAEDQFEAALLLRPNSVEAQVDLARAQILQSDFAGAVEQLGPLSKLQPGRAEVFELLARAYTGAGDKREAAEAEKKAQLLRRNRTADQGGLLSPP